MMTNDKKLNLLFKLKVIELADRGKISHEFEFRLLNDIEDNIMKLVYDELEKYDESMNQGKKVHANSIQFSVEAIFDDRSKGKDALAAIFKDGRYGNLRKLDGYSQECLVLDNQVDKRSGDLNAFFHDFL